MRIPEIGSEPPTSCDLSDKDSAARYIGQMTGQLRRLAETAELPFLAYLLGMAESEALSRSAQPSRPRPRN